MRPFAYKLRFAIVAALAFMALGAHARHSNFDPAASSQYLRARLAKPGITKADSLAILVNLFDLAPRKDKEEIALTASSLAYDLGDSETGLDMVRQLANLHSRSDSLLLADLRMALRWPKSDDREETVCFIKMMQNYYTCRFASQTDKMSNLQTMLDIITNNPPSDNYDRIAMLHSICINMADLVDYTLQSDYINELDSLISILRPEAYALRNIFLVQASLAYQNSGYEKHKAMPYDERLLQVIDEMDHGETGLHRPYRNYDPNRYVIYARLLSNYDSLPQPKFDEYYAKAMEIAASDSVAASTNRNSLRPQIFRAAKAKDYAQLQSLLAAAIDMPHNSTIRPDLLRLQIESSRAMGDEATLLSALQEYNTVLQKQIDDNALRSWRELEIQYDLEHTKLKYESHKSAMQQRIIFWSLVAMALLIIMLVLFYQLLRRTRRLAANLEFANKQLTTERDNLQLAKEQLAKVRDELSLANATKKAFIRNFTDEVSAPLHTINEYTNLIIGNSEQAKNPYLKKYADKVLINSEMVMVILKDLSTLAQIDTNSIKQNVQPESLARICSDAIDTMSHRLPAGVEIELEDCPDITFNTDALRLRHILWQLLSNAAKFTRSGIISVGFEPNDDGGVDIHVADTGIGINPASAERIFDRFVKLDRNIPGAGIGLPIARQLARIIGGDLFLDTTYADGARFIIRLSSKPANV